VSHFLTKDKEGMEGVMGRMVRVFLLLRVLAMAALPGAPPACAEGPGADSTAAQPQTVVDILHQLSDKADVIFAGQVTGILRSNDGVVEVEFRVDQAIVGCTAGTYILREWAGLWAGDNQRYRVGQRLLMLLHAPSAAGMSSPVGGLDGAIPIRQGGRATPLTEDATVTASEPPFVDLRWLGARLPRTVSYRRGPAPVSKTASLAAGLPGQLQAVRVADSGSVTHAALIAPKAESAGVTEGSVPAEQASVDAVVDMLSTWQKARNGAR
jgi:hypothetical protein